MRQKRETAVFLPVELSEDEIPDFHVPVAVAADTASRLAAGIFLSPVVINLAARSARPCVAHEPVIIVLPEPENLVRRQELSPGVEGFVIVKIDCRVKSLRVKADSLCQKFPSPRDCFVLEVTSPREITQHLEKCVMSGCPSDVLNIVRPDTFLTRYDSGVLWLFYAEIVGF